MTSVLYIDNAQGHTRKKLTLPAPYQPIENLSIDSQVKFTRHKYISKNMRFDKRLIIEYCHVTWHCCRWYGAGVLLPINLLLSNLYSLMDNIYRNILCIS